MEQTYWNYAPAQCRKVRVIVGKSARSTWWCAALEGSEREAVEVHGDGGVFYLDNEGGPGWPAGEGWAKVTAGRGGPDWSHSELPVEKVLSEVTE